MAVAIAYGAWNRLESRCSTDIETAFLRARASWMKDFCVRLSTHRINAWHKPTIPFHAVGKAALCYRMALCTVSM